MTEPLLTVDDLGVDYVTASGRVAAVDGVSFTLGEGEVLGLAGESGSGKSTAAQALLRILPPPAAITRGSVRFRGQDVLAFSEAELRAFRFRQVSLVFQSAMNALNPVLSIGEQLGDVVLAHEPIARQTARDRAAEILGQVGIDSSRLTSYPHELSGGMRQRVVIAMALILRPALVIMDEPTTALDVVVEREILSQIDELRRRLGFSILFITHDLSLMLEFCQRIAILYAGKVVESGTREDLLRTPRHPYTAGLLRSSPPLTGPREPLSGIPGNPPDMRNPPSGCRFHPRCERALPECSKREPLLLLQSPTARAACHLLEPRADGATP